MQGGCSEVEIMVKAWIPPPMSYSMYVIALQEAKGLDKITTAIHERIGECQDTCHASATLTYVYFY